MNSITFNEVIAERDRLAAENVRLLDSIAHLHDELASKTGATVDIAGCRYECNPAVAADIQRLREIARLLALSADEGDDKAQGTHYIDKHGVIRCKGSFLELIEMARKESQP
jgi:hypothetical protein